MKGKNLGKIKKNKKTKEKLQNTTAGKRKAFFAALQS